MSTVTLFATLAGAPATPGAGRGRASEESGSLFGAALAIAGEVVDGATAEAPSPPSGAHPADGTAPDAVGAGPASEDAVAALAAAAPASLSFPPVEAIATPVPQPETAQDSGQGAPTAPDAGALAALPVPVPAAAESGTDPRASLAVPGAPGDAMGAVRDGASGNPTAIAHATIVPSAPVGAHSLEVGPDAPAESASSPAVRAATGEGTPAGPGAAAPTVAASASPTPAADAGEATLVTPTSPAATVGPAPQTHAAAVTAGGAPEPTAATPRAVAAQVSPAVVSIAQRPAGTHQLTMTVNPESLGPVTVRAHISQRGEVQVELLGATDAGRDALRTIAADLRRDLAAVMPNATLSLSSAAGADAGWQDRGAQAGHGDRSGGQPGDGRRQSGGDPAHPAAAQGAARAIPTTANAASGAGLDIFV